MQHNVGGIDRLFRFILGVSLLVVLFYMENSWRYIGLIGLVFVANGLTRFCFFYHILGMNTCRIQTNKGGRPQ
ncbi:hypothetical protein D3C73_971090 [compost metagenome]